MKNVEKFTHNLIVAGLKWFMLVSEIQCLSDFEEFQALIYGKSIIGLFKHTFSW